MVLLKTSLSGAALVILGVLVAAVIGQYVTLEIQDVQRHEVEPHAEFLVGDVVNRPYTIPSGVAVFGSVDVTQAPSNKSDDIHLIILDAENYQRWSSGGQADSVYLAQNQGKFNFTFTAEKGGIYYLVFDNRASLYKKYVSLMLAYDEVTKSRVPDTRLPYAGWAVFLLGGLILAYGLIRKPPTPWA